MSKIKLLSIAVTGLLVINLGMLVFLFVRKPLPPLHQDPGLHAEGPKNVIIERLHFSKEQVSRYEKLIEQHQLSVRELDTEVRNIKNTLYSTLPEGKQAGKDSLINRLGMLEKQLETVHYNHFNDIKKLCNPEQLEYYQSLTRELADFFAPGKNFPPPPRD